MLRRLIATQDIDVFIALLSKESSTGKFVYTIIAISDTSSIMILQLLKITDNGHRDISNRTHIFALHLYFERRIEIGVITSRSISDSAGTVKMEFRSFQSSRFIDHWYKRGSDFFARQRHDDLDLKLHRVEFLLGYWSENDAYCGQLVDRRSMWSLCRLAGNTSSDISDASQSPGFMANMASCWGRSSVDSVHENPERSQTHTSATVLG